MKMELYNDNADPIDESCFIWRYMSIKKLMTLIEKNEVYFARLDTFKDPLEGLTIMDRELLSLIRLTKDPHAQVDFKNLYSKKTVSRSKMRAWQNGSYASCWYMPKNKNGESLEMWDLYTDKDSFAFGIRFKIMKDLLATSLETLEDKEIVGAKYGRIDYLGSYDHSMKVIHSNGSSMPGFIKSPIYQHEQEIRFMLLRGKLFYADDRTGISIKLPERLNKFKDNINIITHPDMDFNNSVMYIKKLNSLGFNASMSTILTKNNINEFLSD